MTKKEYNGWTNFETWNVNLWLDNEQSSQEYWQEQTVNALEHAKDTPSVNFRLTRSGTVHNAREGYLVAGKDPPI